MSGGKRVERAFLVHLISGAFFYVRCDRFIRLLIFIDYLLVLQRTSGYFDYLYFLVFGFSYKETSVNEVIHHFLYRLKLYIYVYITSSRFRKDGDLKIQSLMRTSRLL